MSLNLQRENKEKAGQYQKVGLVYTFQAHLKIAKHFFLFAQLGPTVSLKDVKTI